MQKWEYKLIGYAQGKVISVDGNIVGKVTGTGYDLDGRSQTHWNGKGLFELLGQIGLEGWEAVGISDTHILLKRPLM